MLENEATRQILKKGHYSVSLNTKFQLITKNLDFVKATPVESESSTATSENLVS
jgi:DNA repair photolyase